MDMDRWIGVYKSVGTFPLDPALLAELDKASAWAKSRLTVTGVAVATLCSGVTAVVMVADVLGWSYHPPVLFSACAAIGIMTAYVAVLSLMHVQRVRTIVKLARRNGCFERFIFSPAQVERAAAASALGINIESRGYATADIYAGSQTLARLGEHCAPVPNRSVMRSVEVRVIHRHSAGLAEQDTRRPRESLQRCRPLEADEVIEVNEHLGRNREEIAKWTIILVLTSGFVGLFVSMLLEQRSPIRPGELVCPLAATLGMCVSGGLLVSECLARVRLRRSLRDPHVIRLTDSEIREEGRSKRASMLVTSAECLRPSAIMWSVDGEPAIWRTIPGLTALRGMQRARFVRLEAATDGGKATGARRA